MPCSFQIEIVKQSLETARLVKEADSKESDEGKPATITAHELEQYKKRFHVRFVFFISYSSNE